MIVDLEMAGATTVLFSMSDSMKDYHKMRKSHADGLAFNGVDRRKVNGAGSRERDGGRLAAIVGF